MNPSAAGVRISSKRSPVGPVTSIRSFLLSAISSSCCGLGRSGCADPCRSDISGGTHVSTHPTSGSELGFLRGARQSGRGAFRVQCGADEVEPPRTDLTLVLGGGVTLCLGSELPLLQLDVGLHVLFGVTL